MVDDSALSVLMETLKVLVGVRCIFCTFRDEKLWDTDLARFARVRKKQRQQKIRFFLKKHPTQKLGVKDLFGSPAGFEMVDLGSTAHKQPL